jgi:hypothetical protein
MGQTRRPIYLSSGTVECRKCGAILGEMESGVFVAGGAVTVWGECRYSCYLCGRSYMYTEKLIGEAGESKHSATQGVPSDRKKSVLEVVNSLGKDHSAD